MHLAKCLLTKQFHVVFTRLFYFLVTAVICYSTTPT
jgi:hypothetical protein